MKILFLKSVIVLLTSVIVSLIGFTASSYISADHHKKQEVKHLDLINKEYENLNKRYTNPQTHPYFEIHWWGDPIQVDTTRGC